MGNTHHRSHAAAGGADYPTPKQLKEFWTQVACGRITKESFQEFLLGGTVRIRGLNPRGVMRLTRQWDNEFRGKGHKIMEVIGPFYSPRYTWELKPAASWVREEQTKIIFWRSLTDVHFVTPSDIVEQLKATPERDRCRELIKDNLGSSLGKTLKERLGDQLDRCRGVFSKLWNDDFSGRVWERLENSLKKATEGAPGFESRWTSEQSDMIGATFKSVSFATCLQYYCLKGNFITCLEAAVQLRVLDGSEGPKLQPMLKLWQSGNLPIGFDQHERLIVLCSSK